MANDTSETDVSSARGSGAGASGASRGVATSVSEQHGPDDSVIDTATTDRRSDDGAPQSTDRPERTSANDSLATTVGPDSNGSESNGPETNGSESNGSESNGSESNGSESNGSESNGSRTHGSDANGSAISAATEPARDSEGPVGPAALTPDPDGGEDTPSVPDAGSKEPSPGVTPQSAWRKSGSSSGSSTTVVPAWLRATFAQALRPSTRANEPGDGARDAQVAGLSPGGSDGVTGPGSITDAAVGDRSGPADAEPAALPDGDAPGSGRGTVSGEANPEADVLPTKPDRAQVEHSGSSQLDSDVGPAAPWPYPDLDLDELDPPIPTASSAVGSGGSGRSGGGGGESHIDETVTDPHGMQWQRYFGPSLPEPRQTAQLERPARSGRRGMIELVAVALAAALLGGGLGGAVGYSFAGDQAGGPGPPSGEQGQPPAPPEAPEASQGPVESVAATVLPSVVQLRVEGAGRGGEGSGVVLSPDGLLLTNNHVVEAAARGGVVTAVFQDGATAQAEIVGRDPGFDLAVLRARNVSGLTPMQLGNSDTVRVGQQVVAFGSPLGLGGTVTTGIISAINRPVSVGGARVANDATVLNALQTDAAINPGNSGGPLVDMRGQLIGINSAIATTGAEGGSIGVGFAIPANQAKRVAGELERTGKASRAQLGVSVGDDPNISGARIRSVEPGSAAERAGLRAGDLVIRFGGQRILAGEGLQAAVRSRAPQETVELELIDRRLSVTLGASS